MSNTGVKGTVWGQGDGSVGQSTCHASLMAWIQFLDPQKKAGHNGTHVQS